MKSLKPTKTRVRDKSARNITLSLKVSEMEKRMLEDVSKAYTNGNVSEFLRYAAFNFRTRK